MLNELIKQGYLRQITTENRPTWVLNPPVEIVLLQSVVTALNRAYPPTEETGGILFAYPSANRQLIVRRWVELPNLLGTVERKKGYATGLQLRADTIAQCVADGALPIRFHTHPVATGNPAYDLKRIPFFQKTSTADQHVSYLPISVDGATVVMPDALISPNTRDGKDIRFSIYNGFISPLSIRGLLNGERVYLYAVVGLFLLLLAFGRFTRFAFVVAALLAGVVFLNEERKRPRYTTDAAGNWVVSIPLF